MSDLHFLFVQGDIVWRAGLAGLAVVGAMVPYVARARRLAREAAAAREKLPVPVPLTSARRPGDEVCFNGVLTGPRGTRAHGFAGMRARDVKGALSVRAGDRAFTLDGPMHILAGSRESTARQGRRLARRLGLAIAPEDAWHTTRALLLRPGDRVRVHGRLASVAAAPSYRGASTTEAIEPPAGAPAIRAAALRAPRLVAWPLARWGLGVLAGLALWAVIFVGGGALMLRRARGVERGADDGRGLRAAALAAATPFHAEALRALAEGLLHGTMPVTPERIERAGEVYALLGDCAGQVEVERLLGHPEAAVDRATACGLAVPAERLFEVGRFDDASRSFASEPHHDVPEPMHALRHAEAHLLAHRFAKGAEAVRDYALDNAPNGALADDNRLEALGCIADALLARGGDDHARRSLKGHAGRAMCRVLDADLAPPAERRAILGDLSFVWADAQGMEFAKLLLNRTGQALLEEAGPGRGLSPGVYRYGLYPDAYLARDEPEQRPAYAGLYDMGNDIAHMEHYERTHLWEHPFALYAAMVQAGRGDDRDGDDVRVHVVGHAALFLAATGDAPGARALLRRIADVPDARPSPPYWTRPRVRDVTANVNELSREQPFRMQGILYGALDAALARQRSGAPGAAQAVARLRAAVLDREVAVPLQMLEAFARR